MVADSTKADTIVGAGEVRPIVYPEKAERSLTYQKSAKSATRKEVPLGSQIERLEILQQAASNYQKAGGTIAIRYRKEPDALVIVLPEVGICVECETWFSGNDGCPKCRVALPSSSKPAP